MSTSPCRIRFLAANRGATTWYRANVPGRALAALGHRVTLDVVGTGHRGSGPGGAPQAGGTPEDATAAGGTRTTDVLVAIVPQTGEALLALERARDAGAFTVADIDDDPWNLPSSSPRKASFTDPVPLYT